MADEQKGAPAEVVDGSADTAPENATAAVTDAAETPEQKAARLEKLLEDERRLRLQHEQKARDARQELEAARSQPAPTNGAVDPVRQQYDAIQARLKAADQVLAEYPNDVATQTARDFLTMQLKALENNVQQQQINAWLKVQKDVVNASSEPEAIKARALQYVEQGVEAATALAAALGERARQTETERQQADAVARAGMRDKPNTAAGGAPVPRNDSAIPLSEYTRRVDAGDSKLFADVERGKIQVDYTR